MNIQKLLVEFNPRLVYWARFYWSNAGPELLLDPMCSIRFNSFISLISFISSLNPLANSSFTIAF